LVLDWLGFFFLLFSRRAAHPRPRPPPAPPVAHVMYRDVSLFSEIGCSTTEQAGTMEYLWGPAAPRGF